MSRGPSCEARPSAATEIPLAHRNDGDRWRHGLKQAYGRAITATVMANMIDVDVEYLRSAVIGQQRLNNGLLKITGKEKRCLPEVDANYQAMIILIVELVVRPAGIALETNLVDKCNGARGRGVFRPAEYILVESDKRQPNV